MSYSDTWAISPVATNATLLFAAATITGAGAVPLLLSETARNAAGYKIRFTSVGDSSTRTYTIVGSIVGQLNGITTEVVTAPNATTADSTNFWAAISSITASGAMTGNQSIGITGSLALSRTRIRGIHYVGAAVAGSIVVTLNATNGTVILNIATPASATFAEYVKTGGILVGRGAALSDFAIVTLTQVSNVTLICG